MRLPAALAALALARGVSAHPISVNAAAVEVHTNQVTARVEVMCEDFVLLYGYSAGPDFHIARADLQDGIRRHGGMLLRDFMVRNRDGHLLTGRVERVESPEIPEKGLMADELMSVKVAYHLLFPTPRPPDYLTFQQKIGTADGAFLPSILQMTVRQAGREALPDVVLTGEGNVETCEFDWGNSVVTGAPAAASETAPAPPKNMGIESYGAVYGFIYIEPAEVRVEVLLPLLTLESWLPVTRANKDFIEVDEQKAAAAPLREFFQKHNKVMIDGLEVAPVVQRLDFYGVDFKDFAARAEPTRLSAWTARVGVILSYSTKGLPRQVDVTWDLFNAQVLSARAAVFSGAEGKRTLFTTYKPVYTWRNPGLPALPEIAPVRAVDPDEKTRASLAETLLRNIYRAFDYREEKLVYDALARSVEGDLLAETYLKIRAGLLMAEQGGAVSRVDEVNPQEVRIEGIKSGEFTARIKWQVTGTVEHWGHIHTRVNGYEAAFNIRRDGDAWKIHGMDVGAQERIGYQLKVRKF